LIDEVLAVGDANFQQKCFEHLHRLRSEGCTIVLVSHEMASVARFCERTIWLDHGRLMAYGASDQVIQSYLEAVASGVPPTGGGEGAGQDADREFTITSVRVLDAGGKQVREAESGSPVRIEIGYQATRSLEGLEIGVTIFRDDGIRCVDAPLYG